MSLGQAAPVLTINVTGPYAFKDTPVVPSYKVSVTNTSAAAASSIVLTQALSFIDGAYFIAAQPSHGSCDQGGQGITTLNCSIAEFNWSQGQQNGSGSGNRQSHADHVVIYHRIQ
jgi:hypothetical protein